MELIANTNPQSYIVSPYAGGSVKINIGQISHNASTSWSAARKFTILVYFQDINGRLASLYNDDGSFISITQKMSNLDDNRYNTITIIPEISPNEVITNFSVDVEVPLGAYKMFWMVWHNAGPTSSGNNYWDLNANDKFWFTPPSVSDIYLPPARSYFGYFLTTREFFQSNNPDVTKRSLVARTDNDRRLTIGTTYKDELNNYDVQVSDPNSNERHYSIIFDEISNELIYTSSRHFTLQGIEVYGIPKVNQPPILTIGGDYSIVDGQNGILDASGSYDPDGDSLIVEWSQVSGTPVTINDSNFLIANVDFNLGIPHTVGSPETLTFKVTISDGELITEGLLSVTINPPANNPPEIYYNKYLYTVASQANVTFDFNNSYDLDGDPLTYSWNQVSGTPVSLIDGDTPTPSFTAPLVPYGNQSEVLIFDVTVSDGYLTSTKQLTVSVSPEPNTSPVAYAGIDKLVNHNTLVTLDGSGSYDPEGFPLTYNWVLESTTGQTVVLNGFNTPKPTFTTPTLNVGDSNTVLTFKLTVSDGQISSTDTVVITVKGPVVVPATVDYCPNGCGL